MPRDEPIQGGRSMQTIATAGTQATYTATRSATRTATCIITAPNTRARRTPLAAAACLFAALALCAAATTAEAGEGRSAKKKPAGQVSQAKERKGGQAKFEKSSGETTAERDRRLLRECRGRPNAGACLGYAS
jgi:hypothetical protein